MTYNSVARFLERYHKFIALLGVGLVLVTTIAEARLIYHHGIPSEHVAFTKAVGITLWAVGLSSKHVNTRFLPYFHDRSFTSFEKLIGVGIAVLGALWIATASPDVLVREVAFVMVAAYAFLSFLYFEHFDASPNPFPRDENDDVPHPGAGTDEGPSMGVEVDANLNVETSSDAEEN